MLISTFVAVGGLNNLIAQLRRYIHVFFQDVLFRQTVMTAFRMSHIFITFLQQQKIKLVLNSNLVFCKISLLMNILIRLAL